MKKFTDFHDMKQCMKDGTASVRKIGFDLDIRIINRLPFIRVWMNWVREVKRV